MNKDFNQKLTIGWPKKDQSLFESWIDHWKGDFKLSYIQWRIKGHFWQTFCVQIVSDKNKTVVRKILEVRGSLESLRVHWSQKRRDEVRKKYTYMYCRRNSQKQTSAVRSVWWSTSNASALYNGIHRWRSILNCFSVNEKCGNSCRESRADFQISV